VLWQPSLERAYQDYRLAFDLPPANTRVRTTKRDPDDPLPLDAGPQHLLLPLNLNQYQGTALTYVACHRFFPYGLSSSSTFTLSNQKYSNRGLPAL